MALSSIQILLLLWAFTFAVHSSWRSGATVFTLRNRCPYTVWPGVQPSAGRPMIGEGGLRLDPGGVARLAAPDDWSGRFWPRRGCSFDPSTGRGSCQSGDCRGLLNCAGAGASPPFTVAEFTLNSSRDGYDYYDVSLVDGYNAPVMVVPLLGGSRAGSCRAVGCEVDLNRVCPGPLRVVSGWDEVVACKSACLAFGSPEFCCTGNFAGPAACRPTLVSRIFKRMCPTAYSYAYDDPSSVFRCSGGSDYLISFC